MMIKRCPIFILSIIFFGLYFLNRVAAAQDIAGDPSGAATLSNPQGFLKQPIDFIWLIYTASIVFLMKAGVALFGGFLRPKNCLNFATLVFMDSASGALAFWFLGGALLYGGSALAAGYEYGNWFMGLSGFMNIGRSYDVTNVTLWIFAMVFCTIAVSFIACAVAERIKLIPYVIVSAFFCAWVYPVFAHWIWCNGWLAKLPWGSGTKDFSGSSIVHMIGGVMALTGAWAVGPRIGKFKPDGTPNFFKPHNVLYGIIGILILWFGWYGFNPGATLLGTDLRLSIVCINTILSAMAAGTTMFFLSIGLTGKVNIPQVCNATLAGLAAITCPCAWIPVWAGVVVGIGAALSYRGAKWLVDWKMKLDDPLDSVAVHAFGGMWGVLALGIFADGTYGDVKGLITGSGWQMLSQFVCVCAAWAWAFANGCAIFFALKYTVGLRVTKEQEERGLDLVYHGTDCYPGAVFEQES